MRTSHPGALDELPSPASPPFNCRWRAATCAEGPGPEHFRHVSVAEAAAMDEVPGAYLAELAITTVAEFEALAANPRVPLGRLMGVFGQLSPMGGDWPASIEATTRLRRAVLARADLSLDDAVWAVTHRMTRLGQPEMAMAFTHPALAGRDSFLVAQLWQAMTLTYWDGRPEKELELNTSIAVLGGEAMVLCHWLSVADHTRFRPTLGLPLAEAAEAVEAAGPAAVQIAVGLAEGWSGTLDELVDTARRLCA